MSLFLSRNEWIAGCVCPVCLFWQHRLSSQDKTYSTLAHASSGFACHFLVLVILSALLKTTILHSKTKQASCYGDNALRKRFSMNHIS